MASVVGEASSSTLHSASIPPRPRSCTHDVFLSFHGKDSRNGLTGHLLAALEKKGIKTFIDNRDLEMGEVIKDELLKAIEESVFAITVLSPNYASSSWCLDELKHIVECSKTLGLSIVPVFYGVEPSDVRYQKESLGKAFKEQEDRFGQNSEKVTGWRNALTEVANLSGKHFKDEHEATLVESIADHIFKKLIRKLPSSTKNLVGIDSRVEKVMRHIGRGLNDVRFIGIWGMGGIGKTTIANAVYEAIQGEFKVSCFLADVREARERKRIVDKQKQLADKATGSTNTIYDEYEGKRILQTSLCNKKVLLVLDDVSDVIELNNLAGDQDWFGPGSRIIITTRDIQLLKIYKEHRTNEVQGLVDGESLDLFCLRAFKQKIPNDKYLDLAKEVVKYSDGLPLALEVLGSHLCGKSVDIWHDAIEKIKSTPLAKIRDRLEISYDSLDDTEKNIFLDISCFFKGWEKDHVTKLLESCGYKGVRIGIDTLIDRSLVKMNYSIYEKYYTFEMHDLLQDMGRNIVINESPDNPGKRSRLWSKEDIHLVLANNQGYASIQGIVFWPDGDVVEQRHWNAKSFSNMAQLKLLIMDTSVGNFQFHDHSSLPTSLKVLHWEGYPFKTLPLSDQQYELVDIRLEYGAIENLWHGKKFLGQLKHLDLSSSSQLKQTPDISEVPELQKLVLWHCTNLTEVHPSVVQHKRLTLLDLRRCWELEALPGKLEMSSLKELLLNDCWRFENLPEFGECMTSLSTLSLMRTSIKKLPTSLGCLVGLERLNLGDCRKLECLPDITNGLPLLRSLILDKCHLTDESFPPDFGPFPSLTYLDLSKNDFVSIPINIHDSPKLEYLHLSFCRKLQCLPELPSSIRELNAWGIGPLYDMLECFPDITNGLPLLTTLILRDCHLTDESFPPDFGPFPSLTYLDLSRNDFVSIPINIHDIPKLERLELNYCKKLQRLPELPSSIRQLDAWGCGALCDMLECFPDITMLTTLILSDCHLTDESFPPDFGPVPSLTYLDLSYNDFVSIPINIHDSPKLRRLKLNYCKKLQCLPELPSSVRRLEADGCWSLDISEFNILSTVCRAFLSPSQDPDEALLEMVIYGKEIPPWFVHRQDGNSVSIPCDYPRNERFVIALCFQSISDGPIDFSDGPIEFSDEFSELEVGNARIERASVADNGIKSNTIRITPRSYGREQLHIFCLTNDYFSDGFHLDTCFEFVLDDFTEGEEEDDFTEGEEEDDFTEEEEEDYFTEGEEEDDFTEGEEEVPSMTSAARCMSKEDIEDLEKSEIERPPKKKHKKCLI